MEQTEEFPLWRLQAHYMYTAALFVLLTPEAEPSSRGGLIR